MKIQPVLIAFNSYGWIQRAIRSFFRYYPDQHLLVVDNNPPSEDMPGMWSYPKFKFKSRKERDWLDSQNNITVIEHPKKNIYALKHGDGLDLARKWCLENGADAMFHFEPDCLFRDNMLLEHVSQKLEKGYWLVGVDRMRVNDRSIWTAGSTWLLDCPIKDISFLPVIRKTLDELAVLPSHWTGWWDTGQKICFECWRNNKSVVVENENRGFYHCFRGSIKEAPSIFML